MIMIRLTRLRIHQVMGTTEPMSEVLLHPILHWVPDTPSTFLEVIIMPGLQPVEMRLSLVVVTLSRLQFGIRDYPMVTGNR